MFNNLLCICDYEPFPLTSPLLFSEIWLFSTALNSLQSQRSAVGSSIVGILRSKGSTEWLRSSPYLSLLKHYFEDLINVNNITRNNDKNRNRENDTKFHSPDLNFHTKMGELLICLACEYWMDTATIVRSHSEFSKYSSARNQNRTCSYIFLFFYSVDVLFTFCD